METLSSFLGRLKRGRVLELPEEPDSLADLLRLLCEGRTYRIRRQAYLQAKEQANHPMLFIGHFCLYRSDAPGMPLFWWEPHLEQRPFEEDRIVHDYFVHPLTEDEEQELRHWVGALPPESEQVKMSLPLRYGPYRLDEMSPGEMMMLTDGTFCEVHVRQPGGREEIQVWLEAGTSRARLAPLAGHVPVYGVSEAQSRRIEQQRMSGLDASTFPTPAMGSRLALDAKDPEWTVVTVEQLKASAKSPETPRWDPDWLWEQLQDAVSEGTIEQAGLWAQRLFVHLEADGAPPRMGNAEDRPEEALRQIALQTCQELLRRRREARRKRKEEAEEEGRGEQPELT